MNVGIYKIGVSGFNVTMYMLYTCVYLYDVYVCACALMFARVEARGYFQVSLSVTLHIFETESLTEPGTHHCLNWLASLCLPRTGITGFCYPVWLFATVLRICLWSLHCVSGTLP